MARENLLRPTAHRPPAVEAQPGTHEWNAVSPPESRRDDGLMSTYEIVARLGGRVTYRQIDHWIRTGRITPTDPASGSGSWRGWSEADYRALDAILIELDEARALIASFDSGALWRRYHKAVGS